jgi:hypothetical protein
MSTISPDAMTAAFTEWFRENYLDGKLSEGQVMLLAEAFYAGAFYVVKSIAL